jgi:hypothetical protein
LYERGANQFRTIRGNLALHEGEYVLRMMGGFCSLHVEDPIIEEWLDGKRIGETLCAEGNATWVSYSQWNKPRTDLIDHVVSCAMQVVWMSTTPCSQLEGPGIVQ